MASVFGFGILVLDYNYNKKKYSEFSELYKLYVATFACLSKFNLKLWEQQGTQTKIVFILAFSNKIFIIKVYLHVFFFFLLCAVAWDE